MVWCGVEDTGKGTYVLWLIDGGVNGWMDGWMNRLVR